LMIWCGMIPGHVISLMAWPGRIIEPVNAMNSSDRRR
jgi:hypothetical protein